MSDTNLDQSIFESIKLKKNLIFLKKEIKEVILKISSILKNGGKVFICGNGGSAADAQHLSAEFLVRLRPNINRKPFPVVSLLLDSSTFTACSNDYSFEYVFSRNLDALGSKKDILIVLSTSGKSRNILQVLKLAKKKKIISVGFFSKLKNKKKIADIELIIPSRNVARIQEAHMFLGHHIFECVEDKLIK